MCVRVWTSEWERECVRVCVSEWECASATCATKEWKKVEKKTRYWISTFGRIFYLFPSVSSNEVQLSLSLSLSQSLAFCPHRWVTFLFVPRRAQSHSLSCAHARTHTHKHALRHICNYSSESDRVKCTSDSITDEAAEIRERKSWSFFLNERFNWEWVCVWVCVCACDTWGEWERERRALCFVSKGGFDSVVRSYVAPPCPLCLADTYRWMDAMNQDTAQHGTCGMFFFHSEPFASVWW